MLAPAPGRHAVDGRDHRHRQRRATRGSAACSCARSIRRDRRARRPARRRGRPRSWPAQNPRPAPVSTSTRAPSVSRPATARRAPRHACRSLKLFSLSGRLSVSRAMPPSTSNRIVLHRAPDARSTRLLSARRSRARAPGVVGRDWQARMKPASSFPVLERDSCRPSRPCRARACVRQVEQTPARQENGRSMPALLGRVEHRLARRAPS